MKPVLIIENASNSLKINESTGADSKAKKYVMEGIFTEFDVVNRNERVYTANEFVPHLNEMLERKKWGAIYGEFDHPDVFDISMKYVSHIVENASFNKDKNRIDGEIRLLSTKWGQEAKAIVDDGCPLFVSSRAAGVTESNGYVKLKKLFTYDIVADPGFSSAKMNIKILNESLGFSNESRMKIIDVPQNRSHIFDLSDDSKTNDLFNMNKNEFVTKKHLADYSKYLTQEISKIKTDITSQISESKNAPKVEASDLSKMMEYYENLQEQHNKVIGYLDYLAERVLHSIDKGDKLEEQNKKIVEYSNYLAENLDKTIDYSNYIAENLDKSIDYSNYLAENVDKNIDYANYLAENLDKSIDYANYIAENLDKNIDYANYLAEGLEKGINYIEYIAENLDANIGYTEYLAENLDVNIAYTTYIAENLDSAIDYAQYVAECADTTMGYTNKVVATLNSTEAITEKVKLPSAQEFLAENAKASEKEECEVEKEMEEETKKEDEMEEKMEENEEVTVATETPADAVVEAPVAEVPATETTVVSEEEEVATPVAAVKSEEVENKIEFFIDATSNESITSKIDKLIEEAKKREASKDQKPAFYAFLTPQDIEAFESLSETEQESAKKAINESVGFYSRHDVLTIVQKSVEKDELTPEQIVIAGMPEDIKPVWESLDQNQKKAVLAQSRFYDLKNNELVDYFWTTRKFTNIKPLNEGNKNLIDFNPLTEMNKLSTDQIDSFANRFKDIR